MKKLTLIAVIFIVVALLAIPLTTHAAGSQSITRTFQPSSADCFVDQKTDSNHNTDTYIEVSSKKNDNKHGLLTFDLTQIPVGSTVSSATLSLYAYTVPGATRTYEVRAATATWGESTVTWTTQPSYTASASASAGEASGWMQWSSATLASDVQGMVSNPVTRYGWMIKDSVEDESQVKTIDFYSRRYTTDTSLCPKLSVTFTAPWDSYSDTGRLSQEDTFSGTTNVVYMKGTGFLDGTQTYNVSYYDGNGNKIATDAVIALVNVVSGRGDLGNTSEPYEPTYTLTSNPTAAAGTWHAVAQPSGATGFPSTYAALTAAPNTYKLIADDTFSVTASAIPEFPAVIAAIGVAGLCFGIYFWMRKRRLAYVKA